MQLSQITPSPKVSDDLTGAGRATNPAYDGGGFQSVFAGHASAARPEPNGSEPSESERAASAERTGNGAKNPISHADAEEREEDAGGDEQAAGIAGAEVPRTALSGSAKQDGWLLPGFVPAARVPSGTNSVQADPGPTRGQLQSVLSPEAVEGDTATPSGADARGAADSDKAVASASVLKPAAPGAEKPGQSATPSVEETAGSSSRGSVLPADLNGAIGEKVMGDPAQVPGMAEHAGALSLDGQGRLDGVPGRSESMPAELAASTVAVSAEGGTGSTAGLGQSTDGTVSLPGGREPQRDGRETPAETRTKFDPTAPAAQGDSKAETTMMAGAAPIAGAVAAGADGGAAMRGGGSGETREIEGLMGADPAMTDPFSGEARGTIRTTTPSTFSVLQSPDTPRQVALQIAEVVRASGERAVELKLQPQELGRVHLTMSQDATGTLTVSLNAERADTLDLLRRNIDLLGADLRELGYESVDFSFHGDGAGAQQDTQSGWSGSAGGREVGIGNPDGNPPRTETRGAQTSGDSIDIRI